MSKQSSFRDYKQSRERRQRFGPLIFGGLAIVLVAVGALLIFLALRGGLSLSFGPTETPTITPTFTPTTVPPTAIPTETLEPTITLTPTETLVPTPAEPFSYQVQQGDSLISIADEYGVDYVSIMLLNGLTYESLLYAGDTLTIPNPDMERPTPTPLPPNLPRGARIQYFVLPGDSLQVIAEKFLSRVEDIIEENELEDDPTIYPGQILTIPYYIITPTFGPSATPTVEATPEPTATATPEG
jgi:LysM repeat protein